MSHAAALGVFAKTATRLRWLGPSLLLVAAPAPAQAPVNFIDAKAADPAAFLRQYLGVSRKAFKQAFPTDRGVALSPRCQARIKPFLNGETVDRIRVDIIGPLCQGMSLDSFARAYGTPYVDGFGFEPDSARATSASLIGHTYNTVKWCPQGFDLMVIYRANWPETVTVMVFAPGQYIPTTDMRVAPGSPEHRRSCGVRLP